MMLRSKAMQAYGAVSMIFLLNCIQSCRAKSLVWAAPGGGLAPATCMGFASLFFQSGLISENHSSFDAIVSNSAAAFVTAPLLYSEQVFRRMLTDDPEAIRQLLQEWSDAFVSSLFPSDVPADARCDPLLSFQFVNPFLASIYDQCNVASTVNDDYALIIDQSLKRIASNNNDAMLINRTMAPENRVSALHETDYLIQVTVAQGIRAGDEYIALGPPLVDQEHASTTSLACMVPAQYVVESDDASFVYAQESPGIFTTNVYHAPETIDTSDWTDYYFPFPYSNVSLYTEITRFPPITNQTNAFRTPFQGTPPTLTQIVAPTSSSTAIFSPNTVGFALLTDVAEYLVKQELPFAAPLLQTAVSTIYDNNIFGGYSICTQWPEPCGRSDSHLMDGAITDGEGLALTIAHLQRKQQGEDDNLIQIILPYPNVGATEPKTFDPFLTYFASSFNEGVEPGDCMVPPFDIPGVIAGPPTLSKQIFSDSLDRESFDRLFEPVGENTNFSTAVLRATTLDNIPFGVTAGQQVEILFIRMNSALSGSYSEEELVGTLDLATQLVSSEVLLERIQTFVGVPSPADAPSNLPSNGLGLWAWLILIISVLTGMTFPLLR